MTIPDVFGWLGEMLINRRAGPLHFRLILQPLAAATLAIRVAIRDAREGRPPYFFWPAFVDTHRRRELLRLAWTDVGKVFGVALLLDVIYQLIVSHWIYPLQAVIVAVVLAIVPYLLLRGPMTRIVRRLGRHRYAP